MALVHYQVFKYQKNDQKDTVQGAEPLAITKPKIQSKTYSVGPDGKNHSHPLG
jgi:hypothetical protein